MSSSVAYESSSAVACGIEGSMVHVRTTALASSCQTPCKVLPNHFQLVRSFRQRGEFDRHVDS